MQVDDQPIRSIYLRLRHRAHTLRLLATGFVVLMALTLGFGAIPFFLAGDMALTETRAALEMRRYEAEHAKSVGKRDRTAGEPAAPADVEAGDRNEGQGGGAAPVALQTEPAPAVVSPPAAPALGVGDEAFAAAVIRVTDVVLLIALVFIFGSLYRYSMRLSSYCDEKADALRLLEAGDRQTEERLRQITVPLASRREARRHERV